VHVLRQWLVKSNHLDKIHKNQKRIHIQS
jgi:hypothetical protein